MIERSDRTLSPTFVVWRLFAPGEPLRISWIADIVGERACLTAIDELSRSGLIEAESSETFGTPRLRLTDRGKGLVAEAKRTVAQALR